MSILQDLDPQYAKIHAPTNRFRLGIVVGAISLLALTTWAAWQFFSVSSPSPRETNEIKLAIQTQSSPESAPIPAADNTPSPVTAVRSKDLMPENLPAVIRNEVGSKELSEKEAKDQTPQVVLPENVAPLQTQAAEPSLAKSEAEAKPKKPHSEATREKTAAKAPKSKAKAAPPSAQPTAKRNGERDIEIITAIMR